MTGRLPRVVAAGLGPAGPDLPTAGTLAAIERIPHRVLRTTRHPAASAVPEAIALDHLYEEHPSFEEVYAAIVAAVVALADEHGEVLYAVPGSPVVAERTVELLLADTRVEVAVLPALSFLDLAWVRREDGVLEATVRADAFCHSMVRALVGCLLAVGEGRREVTWPSEVLGAGSRSPEVTVAHAHGLSLEEVGYPDDDELAARAEQTRARRLPLDVADRDATQEGEG